MLGHFPQAAKTGGVTDEVGCATDLLIEPVHGLNVQLGSNRFFRKILIAEQFGLTRGLKMGQLSLEELQPFVTKGVPSELRLIRTGTDDTTPLILMTLFVAFLNIAA